MGTDSEQGITPQGQLGVQDGEGLGGDDVDGVLVLDLHAIDGPEGRHAEVVGRVGHPLQAELGHLGVELLPVGELHPLAELELPGGGIDQLVRGGQPGRDLQVLVADQQGVVDVQEHVEGRRLLVVLGVQRRGIHPLCHHHLAAGRRPRRRRQQDEQRRPPDPSLPLRIAVPPSSVAMSPLRCTPGNRRPSSTATAGRTLKLQPGIQHVPQPVPQQIDPQDGQHDAEPRERRQPPRRGQVGPPVGQHASPRRRRRLHAQAQKREGGLQNDHPRHLQGGDHDDRREDVGEQMPEDDPPAAAAQGLGRRHELPRAEGQHLRPHDPGVGDPTGDPEDEDDVPQAGTQDRDHRQGQQDEGHGQHGIRQAHAEVIHPPPPVAGHEADQRPQRPRHRHGGEPDDERDPGPEDEPAQDVPSQMVGPQRDVPAARVGPPRRLQPEGDFLDHRILRGTSPGPGWPRPPPRRMTQADQGRPVPEQLPKDAPDVLPPLGGRRCPPTSTASVPSLTCTPPADPRRNTGRPPGFSKSRSTIIDTLYFRPGKISARYAGPEPRISFNFRISDNTSLKINYNRTRQYLHLLSNSTSISPTDTWKLSDYYLKPQIGDQLALGFYKMLINSSYETSAEVYYKEIKNMVDFKGGTNLIMNENSEEDIVTVKGKAYGLELILRKTEGKLRYSIGYTYSRTFIKSVSKFSEEIINEGKWFPANFDKPNDLVVTFSYLFSRRYSFSANYTRSTGRPITYPVATYYLYDDILIHYSDRNKYRIPDYSRLDLSFKVSGNLKSHRIAHPNWAFSVYNMLGRQNVYSIYFKKEGDLLQGYRLSVFSRAIPTVTFSFDF